MTLNPEVPQLLAALSSETKRSELLLTRNDELRGLLVAIRGHFGRDAFHEMLGQELHARLVKAIGTGIQ